MATSWMDILRAELDAMNETDIIPLDNDIEEGDTVIGDIPVELQKLWTRSVQTRAEALRFTADSQTAKTDRARELAIRKILEMEKKSKLYAEMFWTAVLDHFSFWGKGGVAIRRGWKFMKTKEEARPSTPPFLEKFLGGFFAPED